MRALVIVHDPGSEAGMIGERLVEHGYEPIEIVVAPELANPAGSFDGAAEPTDWDVIVPMGSIYSLATPDAIASWIHDELEFLRAADAAAVPVLGVCFGGQALAAAHGGRVLRSAVPQVGWHPLTVSGDLPLGGPWMQWHYDRFEAPDDAEVLAVDHVGTQAFTLRRNLALQFHPEVDRPHLERWLKLDAVNELDKLGLDADTLLAETEAMQRDSRPRVAALVDWFLDDVARR